MIAATAVEVCRDESGLLLWAEPYVFGRIHGAGETFIRKYREYRVVSASFVAAELTGGLVEHVVELIADRTPDAARDAQ